jgi:hypothetical protein
LQELSTTLILKNGNNTNFTTAFAFQNHYLKCINVDNLAFASTSDVFYKDDTVYYETNCATLYLEESVFNKVTMYPNSNKRRSYN